MQNRYFGDVGDYGKYGLLRQLASPNISSYPLKLGINWYLVPDERHNNDGRHTSYLENEKMRSCDPELFDDLRGSLEKSVRDITAIETALPASTQFFAKPLSYDDLPSIGANAKELRLSRRKAWVEDGLQATSKSELVFFDPDNGLEITSKDKHEKTAPKHIYWDEIAPYQNRGQSVVIYHHLGRTGGSHTQQTTARLNQARQNLSFGRNSFALRFFRGTSRIFLIVPTDDHCENIIGNVARMLTTPWKHHFELMDC